MGNLDIQRDWGWAPEYVEGMWRMLQQEALEDFVIATGRSVSLEYFVDRAFTYCGLDWRHYVRQDKTLFRPSDIRVGAADPSHAARRLGWKAQFDVDYVVDQMCAAAESDDSAS